MRTMETSANKETFKLLKISDDSKSFSDLDLPEITTQRKRKVRRKTRPRIVSSTSSPHPDVSTTSSKQCSALAIWIIVFLGCCWLLTLSYMIAVIHSENLRLEVQIKKLTVTSQNLPEALQQWHETSKQLEQNQTMLYSKISEIQRLFGNFNDNLTQLKARVDEFKNLSNDVKLADFGAKIDSVTGDVERINSRIAEFQKDHTTINASVQQLQNNLTKLTVPASNNSSNSNYSAEIQKLGNQINEELNSVKLNLTQVNDTFTQKANNLNKDVIANRNKIVELLDHAANVTSHVSSIENDLQDYKTKINEFDSFRTKFGDISEWKNASIHLQNAVNEVRSTCNKVQTNLLEIQQNSKIEKPDEKKLLETHVGDIVQRPANPAPVPVLTEPFVNNAIPKPNDTSTNSPISMR